MWGNTVQDRNTSKSHRFRTWLELAEKLLNDIDTGRELAKENEGILDQLDDANKARLVAQQCLTDKQVRGDDFKEALQYRNECGEHELALLKKCESEFAFIPALQLELKLFLQRLPPSQDFRAYRDEISNLRVDDRRAWLAPEDSSSVGLLRHHLNNPPKLAEVRSPTVRAEGRKGRQASLELARLRGRVRRIHQKFEHEGSDVSHEQFCEYLDADHVPMPKHAKWSKRGSWRLAFKTARNAVRRWLSGTLRKRT